MKIDTRLTESDLQATILFVLNKAPAAPNPVAESVLLRDLTAAVKLALETGQPPNR